MLLQIEARRILHGTELRTRERRPRHSSDVIVPCEERERSPRREGGCVQREGLEKAERRCPTSCKYCDLSVWEILPRAVAMVALVAAFGPRTESL